MLNPEFAQVGWRPDATSTYNCSPVLKANGFTYLMALVLSGRNSTTHVLARQAELDAFLSLTESTEACKQVNSEGWNALMLAVRNSAVDSTEATVAQLLAHESSAQVARMKTNKGQTILMLAVYTAAPHSSSTEATVAQLLTHESAGDVSRMQDKLGTTALMLVAANAAIICTQATVAQLLAHESAGDVARMKDTGGHTALMFASVLSRCRSTDATVAQLLAHGSSRDVARMQNNAGWTALMFATTCSHSDSTEATVAQLLSHESSEQVITMANQEEETVFTIVQAFHYSSAAGESKFSPDIVRLLLQVACRVHAHAGIKSLCLAYPECLTDYVLELHQQTRERETVAAAFQAGLSLPASTVLTYI
jgi:ankyrin repeat protein